MLYFVNVVILTYLQCFAFVNFILQMRTIAMAHRLSDGHTESMTFIRKTSSCNSANGVFCPKLNFSVSRQAAETTPITPRESYFLVKAGDERQDDFPVERDERCTVLSVPTAVQLTQAEGRRGRGRVRVSRIGKISKILQTFGGLVLGCIKTKFCKKICV